MRAAAAAGAEGADAGRPLAPSLQGGLCGAARARVGDGLPGAPRRSFPGWAVGACRAHPGRWLVRFAGRASGRTVGAFRGSRRGASLAQVPRLVLLAAGLHLPALWPRGESGGWRPDLSPAVRAWRRGRVWGGRSLQFTGFRPLPPWLDRRTGPAVGRKELVSR